MLTYARSASGSIAQRKLPRALAKRLRLPRQRGSGARAHSGAAGVRRAQKEFSTSAVGFLQRSVLFSLKPHFGTDFLLLSRRDNMQGAA
jgi:hypothetical protein